MYAQWRSIDDYQATRQDSEDRDAVRAPKAHPEAWSTSTARPAGCQDEFVLAAIAQNLTRLAMLVARPPPDNALCTA
jgi:hypothetical protein